MTVINDIFVPAIPGTCYHAILCSLLENKNKLVSWNRLKQMVERNLLLYGGEQSLSKFCARKSVGKNPEFVLKKIKTNTHTLTRTGKNCYGYRLHVRGIAIYYFSDGSMARTGGKFLASRGRYDIRFKDGTGFQKRNRGRIMSYREYKDFVGNNWYDEEDGTL